MAKKLPSSKMLWRSRHLFLSVLLVLMLSPIIFFMMDRVKDIIEDLIDTNRLVQKSLMNDEEQDHGGGSKMPQFDPFVEEIVRFTEKSPILKREGTDWVNCNKSECSVAKEILETVRDVVCVYRDIIYMNDKHFDIGRPIKVIGNERFWLNKSDHVKIDCTGKDADRCNALHSGHWSKVVMCYSCCLKYRCLFPECAQDGAPFKSLLTPPSSPLRTTY